MCRMVRGASVPLSRRLPVEDVKDAEIVRRDGPVRPVSAQTARALACFRWPVSGPCTRASTRTSPSVMSQWRGCFPECRVPRAPLRMMIGGRAPASPLSPLSPSSGAQPPTCEGERRQCRLARGDVHGNLFLGGHHAGRRRNPGARRHRRRASRHGRPPDPQTGCRASRR
jgi:hypothetical protein